MIKEVKQPIKEDVSIYAAEKEFLMQEPNQAIYYINGKVIVKTDSGKYMFTELPEEDAEQFLLGEQIEARFLKPIEELSDSEAEMLFALNELNNGLSQKGICAVAIEKSTGPDDPAKAIIAHPLHPQNTYFYITVPDAQKLTMAQADELLTYKEERTIDNPYHIQFDGDTMIAY